MPSSFPDIINIPLPSSLPVGQHLDRISFCYPGAASWLSHTQPSISGGYTSLHISDSGSYNYFLYSNRFNQPATFVDLGGN
jgi:hypothetical protein